MSMKPADLDLPPKFTDWRPGQLDAIVDAAASEYRFHLLSMPTGGGKSLTGMGVHRLLGGRTLFLTSTKGLQAQMSSDFKVIGLREIKGQNNYKCRMDESVQCNEGPCHSGVECDLKAGGCDYYDAVRVAAKSDLVVANYRYFMTINRYSDPDSIGRFDNLVCDEAHDVADELADFCTIRIDADELRILLDQTLPPLEESQDTWGEWAAFAGQLCYGKLQEARRSAKETRETKYVRLARRLQDLLTKLQELARCRQWKRADPGQTDVEMPGMRTDWVAEATRTGAMFSPVWAHAYAEQYLFRGIPKVILMSATLQPAAARYLGIDQGKYEYRETVSTFHHDRRPLIWVPTVGVSAKWTVGEQRMWINRVDEIIGGRLDRKGITHTGSYDRSNMIYQNSRNGKHLTTHGSRNARDVVEMFKRAQPPRNLVSPSMETGWDFPYDECRYQIITKVPFIDSRAAVIKARAQADKKYLNYVAALRLIQTVGRGMRAEDDWCENFIIDDNIQWFMAACRKDGFMPQWFVNSYRIKDRVPPAMNPATMKLGRSSGIRLRSDR